MNKGNTLIESLFAFMIYTTCIVMFLSLISTVYHHEETFEEKYNSYIKSENDLEGNLWIRDELKSNLDKVLR